MLLQPLTPILHGYTGNAEVTYDYKNDNGTFSVWSQYTLNNKQPGVYTVRANIAETDNYLGTSVTTDFEVTKKTLNPVLTISGWTMGASRGRLQNLSGNDGNGAVTYEYKVKGADDSTYIPYNYITSFPTAPGEYTLRATIAETKYYYGTTVTADFKVSKKTLTTKVTVSNWKYGEEPNTPSVSNNPENGKVTYLYKLSTADDSDYSETVPTDIGNYVVKAIIAETETYAECSATWYFAITKGTLKNAEVWIEDWTYGETAKDPSVTGNIENGAVTYLYFDQYGSSVAHPTKSGTYTVRAAIAETDHYTKTVLPDKIFKINKAPINPTVSIESWEYGKTPRSPIVSDNPAGTNYVSYHYKVKGADDTTYSTSRPSNAGEYTVRATIRESNNYLGGTATADFAITKAPLYASVYINSWQFGKTPNNPSVTGNTGYGDVTYAYKVKDADDSTYSETVPTDAGEYTVRATIAETANYAESYAFKNFTITQGTINPTISIKGWTYGEEPNTPTVTGNIGNGEVVYWYRPTGQTQYETTVPTDAGTYQVCAVVQETANTKQGVSSTVTFAISKAPIHPEVSIKGWVVGNAANQPTVTGNIENANVNYTYAVKGSSSFSRTVPTSAGDYTVKASVAESKNYLSGEATADFTIFSDASEMEAAEAVAAMINALPAAEDVTVDDKDAIEAARAAYDALTDGQKTLIDTETLAKLTAAEEALAAADAAANQAAADAVAEMINALPAAADVTVDDKDAIEAARAAYEALTDAQKALIDTDTLAKLAAAEEAANRAAADAVTAMIDALPAADVTVDDKGAIEAARAAYEALTDAQKAFINNDTLAKLTAAEEALADQTAAKAVADMIDALPKATDVTVDDKDAIEAARAAYEALTDAQKALINNDTLAKLTADEEALAAAEQAAADKAAAKAVADKINALHAAENITVDDKNDIEAARAAYEALTEAQKALIDSETVAKLTAAEEALAAAELAAAKSNAVDKVNAVNAGDYIANDQQKVTDAKSTALAAIEAAETIAEVEAAVSNFNDTISGCTTQAAADLAAAKSNAADTVNAVDASIYIVEDQRKVTDAKSTALAAIEAATTIEEVETAVSNFNKAIADCTTQAAADLAAAKSSAADTVNAVNANDYIAADQQRVTDAKSTALEAIEAATTEADVETAVSNFNNAIADCTTQAAADLAAAKSNAVDKVNAVNAGDYIVEDQQTVTNAKSTALAAIEAAKTIEEVGIALTNFNNAINNCTTQAAADLAAAKSNAIAAVNAVDESIYIVEDQQKVTDAKSTALEAIEAATTEAEVRLITSIMLSLTAPLRQQQTLQQLSRMLLTLSTQ